MPRIIHLAALGAALGLAYSAHAVPTLQLYVEGATYNGTGESWEFVNGNSTRLWVIGDADSGAGIFGVHLSIAYAANPAVTITLTPSTTNGYGGFTDPTVPVAPTLVQINTSGSAPKLSDGRDLPSHGEFGPGVWWHEFSIGNFTGTESPIADFIDAFPAPGSKTGQINVYDVVIDGAGPDDVFHFDAYDHVVSRTRIKYVFAPFSHDGVASGFIDDLSEPLPEPGPVALFGLGCALLALSAWAHQRRRLPVVPTRHR